MLSLSLIAVAGLGFGLLKLQVRFIWIFSKTIVSIAILSHAQDDFESITLFAVVLVSLFQLAYLFGALVMPENLELKFLMSPK